MLKINNKIISFCMKKKCYCIVMLIIALVGCRNVTSYEMTNINNDLRQTEEAIVGSENTNTEVVTEKINQESVEQVHQNEMIYEDYYELLVAEYDAVCEAVDSFYEGILGEVYKPYTNIKISEAAMKGKFIYSLPFQQNQTYVLHSR